MRVAIVGSRDYPDMEAVRHFVFSLARKYPDAIVISGAARGVDSVATHAAGDAGLDYLEYPADWNTHGKSAGFRRNATVVAAADQVVAFWDGVSRGTAHTIDLARQAGKPVHIFTPAKPV